MDAPDRIKELKAQTKVTGIDFVYVNKELSNGLAVIEVHFFILPSALDGNPFSLLDTDDLKKQISVYLDNDRNSGSGNAAITEIRWLPSGDHPETLQIKTFPPKNRALYRLYINSQFIDPYYNDILFSYQAGCPGDLDCRLHSHVCPEDEQPDFPIDYSARDFWSFRRALLDFVSLRYPEWKERLEADEGMMLLEVMSVLGDEFAYYQDRIAREAYLETASQRKSVRRLAHLVDYPVHDGLGATSWIDIEVKTGEMADLMAGIQVWAIPDNNEIVKFEIGRGLNDKIKGQTYQVDERRNSFDPHIWDENDKCLSVNTTEMFIKGHCKDDLMFDDPPEDLTQVPPVRPNGKWILLQTSPASAEILSRRWLVKINNVEQADALGLPLVDPITDEPITKIEWGKSQALPFEMDLDLLKVRGNIIPVTAGEENTLYFTCEKELNNLDIPDSEKDILNQTLEREGPNGSVIHLFSLDKTDKEGIVFLGNDPFKAIPEIRLSEVKYENDGWTEVDTPWQWRRSFLGTHSSEPYDKHFVLEDGTWGRVVGYQRNGREFIHKDYLSDKGKTIRFGDGEFGMTPSERSVFKVSYRVGNPAYNNVPEDTITYFKPDDNFDDTGRTLDDIVKSITNPLPVVNGMPAQSMDSVRHSAPEAYRSVTYRAVLESDYAEAAERLEWVQRASAYFRWTGSWLSAFVTPDTLGMTIMTDDQDKDLRRQLDLFRQTGRETIVKKPVYADIDLIISICVSPDHYSGEVKESIWEVLIGGDGAGHRKGFFSADNFTFGTALERSVIESVIHDVQGVRAVMCMKVRRRGWHDWHKLESCYKVADNEVIRIENNPMHPEYGSLKLSMEGGA